MRIRGFKQTTFKRSIIRPLSCSRSIKILTFIILFGIIFTSNLIVVRANSSNLVASWGSDGSGNGQFLNAHGVSIDSQGNVYIVDTGNYRIQKFTSNGTFLTSWGSSGSGNGQFNYPTGIAVDTQGNVYVADTGNYRIQKFTSEGTFLTSWGSSGSGNGQFNFIPNIAVDTQGNVYVADPLNGRVEKFSSDGTFITKWGNFSTDYSVDPAYMGIALDSQDYVYVANNGASKIQKFTNNGTFITNLGKTGSNFTAGDIYLPEAIAVDSSGNLYVGQGGIYEYNSAGVFLDFWSNAGWHLAVDGSNNLYATYTDVVWKFNLSLLANVTPTSLSRTSVLLASFSAKASGGTLPYTYQWYDGFNAIQGQNSSTLNIIKDTSGSYTFTCQVTDSSLRTVTSNSVALTVNLATPTPSSTPSPTPKPTTSLTPTPHPSTTTNPNSQPSGSANSTPTPPPTQIHTLLPSNEVTSTPTITSGLTSQLNESTTSNKTGSFALNINNLSIFAAVGVTLSASGMGLFLFLRRRKIVSEKKALRSSQNNIIKEIENNPVAEKDSEKPQETKFDVFISYSSHDKKIADALCHTLESQKIRCWIAPRDITPGTNYAAALIQAINNSKIFVLVFSKEANTSPHIIREVQAGVSRGIPIIPFRIEDVKPTKAMEFYLSTPHWLDAMTPPLEKHLQKLTQTIQLLLSNKEELDSLNRN